MSKPNTAFLVVIHDVAPPFESELQVVFERVLDLVGSCFSAAVVPNWHGTSLKATDRILGYVDKCDEVLLHGQTHFRDECPGLISMLTNRSDEMRGLPRSEIQRRIDCGLNELESVAGIRVRGLLPPAWQLPARAIELQNLSYVLRFNRIESCNHRDDFKRLATWSYDWGTIRSAARLGELIGQARFIADNSATPCIAIHPIDFTRGCFPRIERLIRDFLARGFEPIVPAAMINTSDPAGVR